MSETEYKIAINQKFLEILCNLVMEQKRQLIDIIAEDEQLPKEDLYKRYLCPKQNIYQSVSHFARRK